MNAPEAYTRKKIGIAAILGASLMWAVEPAIAKLSYGGPDLASSASAGTVLQTVTVRVLVTALTALVYVLVTRRGSLKITRKQLPKVVYIGLAGTVFADLLYFYAFTKVPVVNAVLIGHMQPVFVVLIGFLVLKEDRLTKYDYLGILILICAGVLVSTRTLQRLSEFKFGTFGDLIVLVATFGWATAGIVARRYLRDMDAGVLTFYRFLVASIALVIISSGFLLSGSATVSFNFYQVLVGIVAGVGYVLYYEGLKRIKAAQASALELSTPFFAALLGYLILHELVTTMQIAGILLLFVGIYFLSKKEELPF
jgi:drug/metabolite transporter (DMT)-like permease